MHHPLVQPALLAVASLLVAAAACAAGPPGRCVITVGGKALDPATHAIIIPEQPTPQEQHAAEDLANHVERMTGKRLPVAAESQLGEKTPIVVGKCAATLKALGVAVDFDALGIEGIAIETKGPALVLAGNQRGVLYAVYTFLEDYGDCRWFTPDCSRIPKSGTFAVADLKVRYTPPLEYRSTDYPCSRDADWAV
ncbi:MAG TPA: alpha-glucuronidase family glycosyl hydrolase, partial [Phycisphaerae bacterium]|nr:alpha-glucuronidase family glycosyl hydrolase [Phycisphaerae bacterium]